jgi:integrase
LCARSSQDWERGEYRSIGWADPEIENEIIGGPSPGSWKGLAGMAVPVLRDELTDYRARLEPAPETLVFGTTKGKPLGATNVRRRILAKAVEHANGELAKGKQEQLSNELTPHSLRRTFASILFAVGESPPYVMGQMGHTTPNLTLSIYARQMDRRDGEPERLKALVQGEEMPPTATDAARPASNGIRAMLSEPVNSGISPE